MTNIIIFHGIGGSPHSYWIPWLRNEIEKAGHTTQSLQFPHAKSPAIETWLSFALEKFHFTEDTILIGHSAGGPLILSILENIPVRVKKAILVAGFSMPLKEGKPEPILQDNYEWERIKSHASKFIFINSDNDPWGCNDTQGRFMQEKLGGELIVLHEGHMGSDTFNQPYKEFPLLLKLISADSLL
ncbi:MAG: alpha/beta hydrolase [Candidatus Diapherotrites archaeon]